jgi:hypothetical protein
MVCRLCFYNDLGAQTILIFFYATMLRRCFTRNSSASRSGYARLFHDPAQALRPQFKSASLFV